MVRRDTRKTMSVYPEGPHRDPITWTTELMAKGFMGVPNEEIMEEKSRPEQSPRTRMWERTTYRINGITTKRYHNNDSFLSVLNKQK